MSQPGNPAPYSILIQPADGSHLLDWREWWQYRELLWYLMLREIKVRYKQTLLGISWAILQPFTQMIIFTFIFSGLAGLDSDGIPYPIFNYAALVPWTFFASGLNKATTSLVSNANMIKKIYFPRIVLPASSVLSGLIDFVMALSILFVMMLAYDLDFTWRILYLPFLLLLTIITALGVSFWLAPLNVQFRDVRYATPFIVQMWFWITPAVYSSSALPAPFDVLYALNPMAGVVEGFRWALVGAETEPGLMVLISSVISVLIFISGLLYFRRAERNFADVV